MPAILHEPSIADVLNRLPESTLPIARQRHWICSLRQVVRGLGRPAEAIPARWTAIRGQIAALHHVSLRIEPKTLANHRANARAALQWFAGDTALPKRGVPLVAEWLLLREQMRERRAVSRLSGLMRYCSARDIAPDAVDEAVLDGYMAYRAESSRLASNAAARRSIARAWNACRAFIKEWPSISLAEPPVHRCDGPCWEDLPALLRKQIEDYLASLTRMRRAANGKRIRPCKEATIRLCRAQLRAYALTALRLGEPAGELTSLSALLRPDLVRRVLDSYWEKKGDEPGIYTIDLARRLLAVARETNSLGAQEIEELMDVRSSLEDYRRGGLTDKNQTLIRAVLTDGVWTKVGRLPDILMQEARELGHAPVKAAVTAQLAVAIAILTFAPVRLGNLSTIELGKNLIKPGDIDGPYRLIFPDYDVKNRVSLDFQLDARVTRLIEVYVQEFRPALVRSNTAMLFPGESGPAKGKTTLSAQITKRIHKATGLRLTVHQFRHAAAAIYLKHNPGNYEVVRRFLGHTNMQTTMRCYVGLETTQANAIFGDLIRQQLSFQEAAE